MLTVVPDPAGAEDGSGEVSVSVIDEIVREGARRMLAACVTADTGFVPLGEHAPR